MFESYSKHVLKHPKAIIAVWIVALLVALPFAAQVGGVLNYDMTSMGGFDSESTEGQEIVDEYFEGSVSTGTILAIPYADDGGLSAIESGLVDSGALSASLTSRYGGDVTCNVMGAYGRTGSDSGVFIITFSFGEGLSAIDEVGGIRAAVSEAKAAAGMSDLTTYVTGSAPIASDTMSGADADMAKVAVERAGERVRMNLAEYLEKGIVK